MKDQNNRTNKISQEIDEARVVQTNSNLGLVDARPGESTFPTGTKNHSTKLDHAFDEVPDPLMDEVALEDDLTAVENSNPEGPEAEHA
jgi:hypothetical protein